jgi:NADP-dependent 3-hydroxy acid dehydrogenase YdfG
LRGQGGRTANHPGIAETLIWVARRPPHVNIDELLIKPVDPAAMHKIHRRPAK